MVLSGDGGDELFGGYYAYPAILWQHRRPDGMYRRLRHTVANGARRLGLWPRLASPADSKYGRTAVLEEEERRRLWRPDLEHLVDGTRQQFEERFRQAPRGELLGRLQYFDVMNYIPFDNLTKVDVASMYHGLEVRVPLLDHVFLETAAQVPPELKLRAENHQDNGHRWDLRPGEPVTGKYLLKKNAERFFSQEFLHREKRGFEVPVRRWFAGPYREELRGRILDPAGPLSDLFQRECLTGILDGAADSRLDAWKAWSLLVLAEWCGQRTGSREQGAGSGERGAGSREQGAGSREQGAGSREQGAGSGERGAGSGERGAGRCELKSVR
jgi:asparagine synthase (glutamine-hydrolysing)